MRTNFKKTSVYRPFPNEKEKKLIGFEVTDVTAEILKIYLKISHASLKKYDVTDHHYAFYYLIDTAKNAELNHIFT